jgi:hypothetical protein
MLRRLIIVRAVQKAGTESTKAGFGRLQFLDCPAFSRLDGLA